MMRMMSVDAAAQLAGGQREATGVLGQLHRVGLRPDPCGPYVTRHRRRRSCPRGPRRPAASAPGRTRRSAGTRRPPGPRPRRTSASTTTWSPGVSSSTSSSTTSVTGTSKLLADPSDPGPGRGQDAETVEGLLGPDLLDDPDEGVGHQDPAEEGVLDGPDDQDHDQQPAQQQVEPGDEVGPEDLAEGPGVGGGQVVAQAAGPPVLDLGPGEPGRSACGHVIAGRAGPAGRRGGGRWWPARCRT